MILDTNTFSALKAGDPQVVSALATTSQILLPFVVLAELEYGYLKGERTALNQQQLNQYLSQPFVTVIYPTATTYRLYAQYELHARRNGRTLSNNDIWIAALTAENGDRLVTYDQDFGVFADLLGSQLTILQH